MTNNDTIAEQSAALHTESYDLILHDADAEIAEIVERFGFIDARYDIDTDVSDVTLTGTRAAHTAFDAYLYELSN